MLDAIAEYEATIKLQEINGRVELIGKGETKGVGGGLSGMCPDWGLNFFLAMTNARRPTETSHQGSWLSYATEISLFQLKLCRP